MRLLDISFARPEENLAFDEVLLNDAESLHGSETLRFWESEVHFVVVGVSQIVRQEVHEKNCFEDHIRVARRCSAGGCVLQGPGCLNYTMILSHDKRPELETVRGSYCFILDKICQAFQQRGVAIHHKGVSDLALGGMKVSGSAQKRRRRCILHHGTLIHYADIDLMERYLREPVDRPQYRGPRTHRGFVRAIPMTPSQLRETLCEAFGVQGRPAKPTAREQRAAQQLALEKYITRDWVWRR